MYKIDEQILEFAYKQFDKTPEETECDIKLMKNWILDQDEFPEIMDETKIRNFILLCKFNLDGVKERIKNYYKVRPKYPDLFENSNPKLQVFKDLMEVGCYYGTHPKLIDGLYRVTLMKPIDLSQFHPIDGTKLFFDILEVRLQTDVMFGDIIVVDMANLELKTMLKITPALLIHSLQVYRSVFSVRLKAAFFINGPSYVGFFIKLLKLTLPAKLMSRIKFSGDSEVLKEIFSDDDLPEDYGGKGPSVFELNEQMKDRFVKFQERFDFLDTLNKKEE